ncbi:Protein of unknown function [Pyronema omphalodes CBS 100304]|uniref:Uncharacterized protein n=1 Tax=Pyronema omphalodes (strain CBS 100304) TaxID=1076935 RepID=U4LAN9_PYROM|nr:Protein of unknown function [Pyronema omphalodes CBS 100304]
MHRPHDFNTGLNRKYRKHPQTGNSRSSTCQYSLVSEALDHLNQQNHCPRCTHGNLVVHTWTQISFADLDTVVY